MNDLFQSQQMAQEMEEEERGLLFFLLNSPLFPEGKCPPWFHVLTITSRAHIPPWKWESDIAPTDEERDLWAQRILLVIRLEEIVRDFNTRAPSWVQRQSPLYDAIMRYARTPESGLFESK